MNEEKLRSEIEEIENAIKKQLLSANIGIEVEEDDENDLCNEIIFIEETNWRDGLIDGCKNKNDETICFNVRTNTIEISVKNEIYSKAQFSRHGFAL